jgi:hypothetical protein
MQRCFPAMPSKWHVYCEQVSVLNLHISAEEKQEMENLVEVLRPVVNAVADMSADKFVTISRFYPFVEVLLRILAKKCCNPEPKAVAQARSRLADSISERLAFVRDADSIYAMATFLDPSVSSIVINNPKCRDAVRCAATDLNSRLTKTSAAARGTASEAASSVPAAPSAPGSGKAKNLFEKEMETYLMEFRGDESADKVRLG